MAEKRAATGAARDALSMLVRAHDDEAGSMSDTDLVGQTTILFGASYETTVNAMTWSLFLIAQHPEVQHQLLDELEGVLGEVPGDEPPTLGQLARLPLLEAALKESMRLLPPVPFTIRATVHGARLGHLDVRDGDRVVCSHYLTHHMPELYPDPERFNPHRWASINPTQYEYLPFSAGPRLCVGYLFAMTALKATLAMILPRWRIAVRPGALIDRGVRVTMAPRHGLPVTFHRQDRRATAAPIRGNIHEMVEFVETVRDRARTRAR